MRSRRAEAFGHVVVTAYVVGESVQQHHWPARCVTVSFHGDIEHTGLHHGEGRFLSAHIAPIGRREERCGTRCTSTPARRVGAAALSRCPAMVSILPGAALHRIEETRYPSISLNGAAEKCGVFA